MLWQASDEFLVERIEVGQHDVEIFVSWVNKRRAVPFVAVELVIFRGLSEAEDINFVIFVNLIVE